MCLQLDVVPKQKPKQILKQWETSKKTYTDMMLGMKLLRAATESGYPQSWACLRGHADSLCCWALCVRPLKQTYSCGDKVTPNLAESCCRDAGIIKVYGAYLYGRRDSALRVTHLLLGQWQSRNPISLPTLSTSRLHAPCASSSHDDDEYKLLIRSVLFEDVDSAI